MFLHKLVGNNFCKHFCKNIIAAGRVNLTNSELQFIFDFIWSLKTNDWGELSAYKCRKQSKLKILLETSIFVSYSPTLYFFPKPSRSGKQ